MDKYQSRLQDLLENYIKPAGVTGKKVLSAVAKTPRHHFVPLEYKNEAYLDIALPIGEDQTISQPSLVALMTQLLSLKGDEKVLEVGTGSGYQAAILAKLAKQVYTVEIIESLAIRARETLKKLGVKNVEVVLGNGSIGLPERAPYDAIIVTAGARQIPKQLVSQLKENGRMVIPVGQSLINQELKLVIKKKGKLEIKDIEPVAFVPLVGKSGWQDNIKY